MNNNKNSKKQVHDCAVEKLNNLGDGSSSKTTSKAKGSVINFLYISMIYAWKTQIIKRPENYINVNKLIVHSQKCYWLDKNMNELFDILFEILKWLILLCGW